MNPEPTVGVKWRTHLVRPRRVIGVIDGAVVSRFDDNDYPTVNTLDWWRENAIIIPDPPQVKAGYCAVWQGGAVGHTQVIPADAWRWVGCGALGVVEVIPDDHGGARVVPVDRDGNRIGGES